VFGVRPGVGAPLVGATPNRLAARRVAGAAAGAAGGWCRGGRETQGGAGLAQTTLRGGFTESGRMAR